MEELAIGVHGQFAHQIVRAKEQEIVTIQFLKMEENNAQELADMNQKFVKEEIARVR